MKIWLMPLGVLLMLSLAAPARAGTISDNCSFDLYEGKREFSGSTWNWVPDREQLSCHRGEVCLLDACYRYMAYKYIDEDTVAFEFLRGEADHASTANGAIVLPPEPTDLKHYINGWSNTLGYSRQFRLDLSSGQVIDNTPYWKLRRNVWLGIASTANDGLQVWTRRIVILTLFGGMVYYFWRRRKTRKSRGRGRAE